MARIGVSSSGHVWVSKMVGGCFLSFIYIVLMIVGFLGIAALIYSLT